MLKVVAHAALQVTAAAQNLRCSCAALHTFVSQQICQWDTFPSCSALRRWCLLGWLQQRAPLRGSCCFAMALFRQCLCSSVHGVPQSLCHSVMTSLGQGYLKCKAPPGCVLPTITPVLLTPQPQHHGKATVSCWTLLIEASLGPSLLPPGPHGVFQVYFYSLLGVREPRQVSFGPEVEREGVGHAAVYPDGLVVMSRQTGQLWAVVGLQEPRVTRLPMVPALLSSTGGNSSSGGGGSSRPGGAAAAAAAVSCLAVLEPRFTLSSGLEASQGRMLWSNEQPGLFTMKFTLCGAVKRLPLLGHAQQLCSAVLLGGGGVGSCWGLLGGGGISGQDKQYTLNPVYTADASVEVVLCYVVLCCVVLCCCWQVLVAVGETVWVVDDHGCTDQPLPAGCGGVSAMTVSPNGAFLALACPDGKLRVMSSGDGGGVGGRAAAWQPMRFVQQLLLLFHQHTSCWSGLMDGG
jgi:hypothetical protein